MLKKYPDFWHVIIGNGSTGAFLGYVVVAIVCAAVSVLIEASNRDLSSSNSPVKFSWKFLWAANAGRFIANFLCIPIAIRLIYEYAGAEVMLFLSIGIGFGVDRLGMLLKNAGILTTNRLAKQVADKLSATDVTVTPPKP